MKSSIVVSVFMLLQALQRAESLEVSSSYKAAVVEFAPENHLVGNLFNVSIQVRK